VGWLETELGAPEIARLGLGRLNARGGNGSTGQIDRRGQYRTGACHELALITAHHHSSSLHHTGPWYIALPVLAVVIGLTIWRWHRWGGGGGLFGGSGDQ
jgi:hypothetical protein